MEVFMSMEGRHRRLGAFEGLDRFLPYPISCRHHKRTGTSLVGKGHTLPDTRNRYIDKIKSRYWKVTHKFGIEMRKHWDDEAQSKRKRKRYPLLITLIITKRTVRYLLQTVKSNPNTHLIGYKQIMCHLVFGIKLDGSFTRKARFAANGLRTKTPKSLTYSSVVSRDSVRIAFLMASLNDLDISACDISGAYLNAPCGEKVWFKAGNEKKL